MGALGLSPHGLLGAWDWPSSMSCLLHLAYSELEQGSVPHAFPVLLSASAVSAVAVGTSAAADGVAELQPLETPQLSCSHP